MPWNDRGNKAITKQIGRVIDARAEHGNDSPEAEAEEAKFKTIERNPRYQAK